MTAMGSTTGASPAALDAEASTYEGIRRAQSRQAFVLILAWAAAGLPLAWGVSETLRKTLALFE